ncbi:putative T7SS-secreted protein [Saccharopolyspora elongata]|nr:ADP-ribosyltransferase [Saccharopolyspora elongata]
MAPDPREEVPGELPAVDETLATMTKLGTAFENAAQGFQKIDTAGWEGPTADAFRDYYQQEPPKWFRAADAFTESADALRQYREVLAWAQRQAEQACADIERADRQTAQAEAKYEQAADQGNATEPFQDPGAAARNQAQASLDAAKEQVEEAAKKAASALIKASEKAPPQPGPLTMLASGAGDIFQNVAESYGDFWKGSFDGALDMLQQVRTLNPFDPYNVMHPQQYGENISQLAASTVAAGKAFISDPIGTGKAMIGAGIDSFTKDPAGFLGRLAPEVAAGLATSGSSMAGSLGRQALDALADTKIGQRVSEALPKIGHAPEPGQAPGHGLPPQHQPTPDHGQGTPPPNPAPHTPSAAHPAPARADPPPAAHHSPSPGTPATPTATGHAPSPTPQPEPRTPTTAEHHAPRHASAPQSEASGSREPVHDAPSTPAGDESRPRLSWGRGASRAFDDDPDWGDPWDDAPAEPRHHQRLEPPDVDHGPGGTPHDPSNTPEPAPETDRHPNPHDGLHDEDREPDNGLSPQEQADAETARLDHHGHPHPELAELTDRQVLALTDYRGSGYDEMNEALRNQDAESLARLEPKMQELDSALEKMAPHEGRVYRGFPIGEIRLEEVLAKYEPGQTVREDAYTSTSARAPFHGNVQLIIDSAQGRDLRFFDSSEAEVLFSRGTEFLVTARRYEPDTDTWKIYLTDPK